MKGKDKGDLRLNLLDSAISEICAVSSGEVERSLGASLPSMIALSFFCWSWLKVWHHLPNVANMMTLGATVCSFVLFAFSYGAGKIIRTETFDISTWTAYPITRLTSQLIKTMTTHSRIKYWLMFWVSLIWSLIWSLTCRLNMRTVLVVHMVPLEGLP